MKDRTFYPFSIAFFSGVFIFSFVSLREVVFLLVVAILSIFAACKFARRETKSERVSNTLLSLGILISFCLGGALIESSKSDVHPLDGELGQKIALQGIVCSEPATSDTTERFCFEPRNSDDRVLAIVPRYPEHSYGEELTVTGKIALPKNFLAYEGGPEFDYVSYLAKDDIRYEMFMPKVEVVGENRGNPVVSILLKIKKAFTEKSKELIPEPEASLLGGLLLGDRQSLPKDIVTEFKNAGLVHVLVLSGYNVTIVAESLMRAFSFLPRMFGQSLGALSIILFALMTGASATTVRASIMALIVILARNTSRRYDVIRALLIAAFFMILQNPRIVAFDTSFQLSFLATVALIYVSPLVEDRLTFVSESFKLRQTLATTISTQIFVLPFILHVMGQLSVISFVSNIFVLPAVPHAMLAGFLATSVGFISHMIALPFSWIATILLAYMLRAVSFFGNLPFASIQMTIGTPLLVGIYAFYVLILYRLHKKKR